MNIKINLSSINTAVIAIMAVFVFVLMFSGFSAFAKEAESGGGTSGSDSSSVSGGGSSVTPRVDDNPSASDLAEGTRVFVPEASGSSSGLGSGFDSARDIAERGAASSTVNATSVLSGFDSARDIFERNLGFGMLNDDDVVKLQNELKIEGFFNDDATGNFLELTKEAVIKFQNAKGISATGFVGPLTREELNKKNSGKVLGVNTMAVAAQLSASDTAKLINELTAKVKELQSKLDALVLETARTEARPASITEEMQKAAGVIITGGVSGPGYPTGPLNMVVPATQLLLDQVGQAKGGEVKGRKYEAPLETIPPTLGSFPVTINGVANTANEIKVISNLKIKNGVGQHQGTIDVDIDVLPAAGHVTLQYSGTATVTGSTIFSKGTFKTSKTTGIFAGLVAEGNYDMTIVESGQVFGSPATVTITTVSP